MPQSATGASQPAVTFDTWCDRAGSDSFLRAIIDALPAHIAILDDAGVVLAVNDAWRRFASDNGYKGATFSVGEPYLAVCDTAAVQGVPDACEVGQGIRSVISGRASSFRHDYRCDLPSGPRWYQMRVTRFAAADHRFVIVAHEDITEARTADDAIRASEQRLRAVLTAAPIVLFALDDAGAFTFSAGEGLKNLGLSEGQVVGKSVWELYADHPEIIQACQRALRGESFTHTAHVGGRVWETRYAPQIDAQGQVSGVIGAAIDATELARYRDHLELLVAQRTAALERSHEQLTQADRLASLGTLAAGLGHDIANLLLPIRCHLDALEKVNLPAPRRDDLVALRQAVDLLNQLCSGLRLCALDPRQRQGSEQTTDICECWAQVGPVIARSVPQGISFQVDIPPESMRVTIAPHLLAQAVLNLVLNACEAISAQGSVRLSVRADEPRGVVVLSVSDDGVGMTPEVRRHAMEPFFTTKKRGRATGLGLSVVHSAVHSAGGSVEIDSTPGQGATISLVLPRATSEPAPSHRSSQTPAEAPVVGVSIADPRRAALLVSLLSAAGAAPIRLEGADPEDVDIWITEPLEPSLEAARRYLAEVPGRTVIVYGTLPNSWAALGASWVDESRGLEGVREALRLAVARAKGNLT